MRLLEKKVLNGSLSVGLSYANEGTFHPKSKDFREKFEDLKDATQTSNWYFPSLGFTNQVMWEADGLPHFEGFYRSLSEDGTIGSKADGLLIPRIRKVGMAICSADCLLCVGIAGEYKFMLHLGIANLIRKEEEEPSLVMALVLQLRMLEVDPKSILTWIGFGATHMSYGIDEDDDRWAKIQKWQETRFNVVHGPRTGKPSVDLRNIAKNQFLEMGLTPAQIEINNYDTALGVDIDAPGTTHFSNLMGCAPLEKFRRGMVRKKQYFELFGQTLV